MKNKIFSRVEDTGDVHCTGMALCRTGERFAYKAFSGEKITHTKGSILF